MEIKDKELHKIAITAIIYNSEGRYLITKRAMHEDHFPGLWTVPGGKLSTDDYTHLPFTKGDAHSNQWYYSLTNTLKREVREEVGLEIDSLEYLLDLTFIKANGTPVLVLSYIARHASGEVILGDDETDFRWVSVGELSQYELISGIDDEIRQADEILKKRKVS